MTSIRGILIALAVVVVTAWWFVAAKKKASSNGKKEDGGETKKPTSASSSSDERALGGGGGAAADAAAAPRASAPKKKKSRPIKPSSHPRYVRRFGGHTGNVLSFSVSPDGKFVATSGDDSQLRVVPVDKDSPYYLRANVERHDRIVSMSWLGDGRTLVCVFARCNDVAFYRMRRKHDDDDAAAGSGGSFPYELVELPKRRFDTSTKMSDDDEMIDVVADRSHRSSSSSSGSSPFGLILTHGTGNNAIAWDSSNGKSVGTIRTGGGGTGRVGSSTGGATQRRGGTLRLSPDGKFVCGRIDGSSNEIKLHEIRRKKIKGEVEPVFDSISSKSATTIVSSAKTRVADVDFFFDSSGLKAAVVCINGLVQIFDVDVDCRNDERPKLLCETRVDDDREPVCVAATASRHFRGRSRIAIATKDRSVHLFTFESAPSPKLACDFVIENVHATGVAELQFDPRPVSEEEREAGGGGGGNDGGGGENANFLFTRGASSKEVFQWNVD